MKLHFIWVEAHKDEIGNELADILAKLGMMNLYQTKNWNKYKKKNTKKEWENISFSSIKKEQKRKGIYRTYNLWHKYKLKKMQDIKENKIKKEEVLSYHLMKWKIRYCGAFKIEIRNLKYWQWKILSNFRSGHNGLNAQKKYGFDTKNCVISGCDAVENTYHFVFECEEYKQQRNDYNMQIKDIYKEEYKNNLISMPKEERLKFALFPFQQKFYDKNIVQNKNVYDGYIQKRLLVIRLFCKYVMQTKRFDDNG
jgi:hypothetical protein